MESLSWLFFCLAPFALFCSESGNGLILCPVFIILGFVCKWIGNNGGSSKVVVKVEPRKFWEWHYKDRMRSTLAQKDTINDRLMALKDKEARDWATAICGYHNAWVPFESAQEEIARANGVITEKMIKERDEKKDRVQVAKHFLMDELGKKYGSIKIGTKGVENCCIPSEIIKKDRNKIKLSDNSFIDGYWIYKKYSTSIEEMLESLSMEEKNQATRWIEEYEKKLITLCNEYARRELYSINVEVDF